MKYFSLSIILFIAGCTSWQLEAERNNSNYHNNYNEAERRFFAVKDKKIDFEYLLWSYKENKSTSGISYLEVDLNELKKFIDQYEPLCRKGDAVSCEAISKFRSVYEPAQEKIDKLLPQVKEKLAEEKNNEDLERAKEKEGVELAKQQKLESIKKYEELGGDEFYEACVNYEGMEHFKKQAANEKAIGAEVGVVDKQKLHQAGSFIMTYKRELPIKIAAYEKKMKKKFNPAQCKDKIHKSVKW